MKKVNAVGKKYSVVERAYLAGLLDGDGAIMACIEKHSEKKFNFRIRIVVKITQSKKINLEWLKNNFKVGLIKQNRSAVDWIIRDQQAVDSLLKLIIPYLRVKKKQAEIALKILKIKIKSRKTLIKVARLADSLSRFNVRSQNRRKNFASMI
jgi:hypothetical protein